MEYENYFGNFKTSTRFKKNLVVIICDISDHKQRTRMVKLLEGFGSRVQKSAFEARLDEKGYIKRCDKIGRLVQPDDHVKIYRLSGAGITKIWGKVPDFDDQDVIII